jgi:N-methylhydantoinase A
VAREFQFERASTTLLSAYVQPVIDGYLHRFEEALAQRLSGRSPSCSQRRRLPAKRAPERHLALYSGPAAGGIGRLARPRARASTI